MFYVTKSTSCLCIVNHINLRSTVTLSEIIIIREVMFRGIFQRQAVTGLCTYIPRFEVGLKPLNKSAKVPIIEKISTGVTYLPR